ncbi:MAG: monofunctional biosynthetic peptidoglycan transglycosylase [Chitinophagaceae bacterium]
MRKFFFKLLWRMFFTSLIYVVICKWIMPPITITQLTNWPTYGLKRDYVAYSEIAGSVKLAAIASEDQAFPDHFGIDFEALQKSITPKKGKRKNSNRPAGAGASTITQQTAKNVFLWQGTGITRYIRKVPEAYFSLLIELIWGKERIMEVYLNTIEMGPGIFGIEAAAQHYFHKSAKQLTRKQAAMIISCLPNPKRFSVVPMSKRVSWRHTQVLKQMNNIADMPEVRALVQ